MYIQQGDLTGKLPALSDRSVNLAWQTSTLDVVHWRFLTDEAEAWREFIPHFVMALGYNLPLAKALLNTIRPLRNLFGQQGQTWLEQLNLTPDNRSTLLETLQNLAQDDYFGPKGAVQTHERLAILWLWRGKWHAGQDQHQETLRAYRQAGQILPASSDHLGQQLSLALSRLGWTLVRRDSVL